MIGNKHLPSPRNLGLALTTLMLALVAPCAAMAQTVSGTTGATKVITAPKNITESGIASNSSVFAFQEQQNVTLANALGVDISKNGTYTTYGEVSAANGTVAAGTKVDSFFLSSNPVGSSVVTYKGSITFTQQILGLEVTVPSLDGTDSLLGATGTTYPGQNGTSDTLRGLEFDGTDGVMLDMTNNGYTLDYNFTTATYVDQIRIITAAGSSTVTPEPSSLIVFDLGALALGGIVLMRRKQAGSTSA